MGIVAGNLLPTPLILLCPLTLAFGLLCVRREVIGSRCIAAFTLLCGTLAYHCDNDILCDCDLRILSPEATTLVEVEGTLEHRPTLRTFETARHPGNVRAAAVLEVDCIRTGGGEWKTACGKLLVRAPFEPGKEYHGGARVRIQGALAAPPRALAPGLFDYRDHLKRLRIHRLLHTQGPADWSRLGTFDPQLVPWGERFEAWARQTLARGLDTGDDALRLTWAMALGWKTALTPEVSDPFLKTGTMHIFAISGLHVALFSDILVRLLGALRIPRWWAGTVIVPAMLFYTAATGWEASALRAALMMTLVIGAWMLARPPDLMNSLGAAALLILAWDPQQLFQPGFQLSFLVVLSLCLLQQKLSGWHTKVVDLDPWLPEERRPAWKIRILKPVKWLDQALSVSLAAWIGSLPLICELFHLVTPSSLVANLIIVPISDLALMCQIGSLLCGDWLYGVGELFNHSAWFWMKLMMVICRRIAELPWSSWHVAAPGTLELLFMYGLLLTVTLDCGTIRAKRFLAGVLILALAGKATHDGWQKRQSVEITVLENDGSAVCFADLPGDDDDVLLNCGNEQTASRVVVPWMNAQGLDAIPLLILQQGDIGHSGGLGVIASNLEPSRVIAPNTVFRSPQFRRMIQSVESNGLPVARVGDGQVWGYWRILHPPPGEPFRQGDDGAMVALLEWRHHRILFCGNLGKAGQKAFLQSHGDIRADLIIAGIPTRDEPLREELLTSLGAKTVIVSERQMQSSRASQLESRLSSMGLTVYRTQRDGTIRLRLRPGSLSIETRACWLGDGPCDSTPQPAR